MTTNRRNYTEKDDFPPQMWITLRTLWETGKYTRLKDLHDAEKHHFTNFPPLSLLQKVADDMDWYESREKFEEIKSELERRNAADLLAELGMNQKERLKYLANTIRAADGILDIVRRLQDSIPALLPGQQVDKKVLNQLKSMNETVFKGMTVSLHALQEAHKLTGEYAPEKIKDVKSGSYGKNGRQVPVDDLSEEELLVECKRLIKLGYRIKIDDNSDTNTQKTGE